MSKITPTASAAILLSEGHSITDMYDQVVSISEELRTEKSEKRRVELYLDQILQEVKHKAPMIDSLTNDYRRAVESHDMLSARMDKMQRAMTESADYRAKAERERDELQSETVKLQRESEDLSRQVQSLLQEQMKRFDQVQDNDDRYLSIGESSRPVFSANDAITDNLVTFKNVGDLQRRNQQLLAVVRALSDDKEAEIAARVEYESKEASSSLQTALKEIDIMKEARNRQEAMVASIVRQRDMYRILLTQADGKFDDLHLDDSPMKSAGDLAKALDMRKTRALPGGGNESGNHNGAPSEAVMSELTKVWEQRLEEKTAEVQMVRAETKETIQMLKGEIEEAQLVASKEKLIAAKALGDVKFFQESNERSRQLSEVRQKEIDRYQQESTFARESIAKHERSLADISTECAGLRDNLRRQDLEVSTANGEKQALSFARDRLAQENESLRAESGRMAKLLESVQRIEAGMEADLESTRARLEAKASRLETDTERLRKELKEEKELQLSLQKQHGMELKESAKQLETLQVKAADARGLFDKAEAERSALEVRCKVAEDDLQKMKDLAPSDTAPSAIATPAVSTEATTAQSADDSIASSSVLAESAAGSTVTQQMRTNIEIRRLKVELAETKLNLEEKEKVAKTYQGIAQSMEKALNDFSTAAEKSKAEELERTKEVELKLERTVADLERVRTLLRELEAESNALQDEVSALKADKEKDAVLLKEATDAHDKVLNDREARENALKDDIKLHEEARSRSEENFQRQVLMHAETVKEVDAMKTENATAVQEAKASSAEASNVAAQFLSAQTAWNLDKTKMEEEVAATTQKTDELKRQNDLIHNQLEIMSAQFKKSQRASLGLGFLDSNLDTTGGEGAGAAGAGEDSGKEEAAPGAGADTDQVELEQSSKIEKVLNEYPEVIRYLRKENTLSNTRLEQETQKARRLEAEKARVLRDLEEVRAQMNNMVTKSDDRVYSEQEFKKVQDLAHSSALNRESNTTLRMNLKEMEAKLDHEKNSVATLKNAEIPLQQSVEQLTSQVKSLEEEKKSITAQAEKWQLRVDSLTKRYHQIDPEEFKASQEEVKKLQAEIIAVTKDKDAAYEQGEVLTKQVASEKKQVADLKRRMAEVAGLKGTIAKMTKEAETQKETIIKFKKNAAGWAAKSKRQTETIKEMTSEQSKPNKAPMDEHLAVKTALTKAQSELSSAKAQTADLQKKLNTQKALADASAKELAIEIKDHNVIKGREEIVRSKLKKFTAMTPAQLRAAAAKKEDKEKAAEKEKQNLPTSAPVSVPMPVVQTTTQLAGTKRRLPSSTSSSSLSEMQAESPAPAPATAEKTVVVDNTLSSTDIPPQDEDVAMVSEPAKDAAQSTSLNPDAVPFAVKPADINAAAAPVSAVTEDDPPAKKLRLNSSAPTPTPAPTPAPVPVLTSAPAPVPVLTEKAEAADVGSEDVLPEDVATPAAVVEEKSPPTVIDTELPAAPASAPALVPVASTAEAVAESQGDATVLSEAQEEKAGSSDITAVAAPGASETTPEADNDTLLSSEVVLGSETETVVTEATPTPAIDQAGKNESPLLAAEDEKMAAVEEKEKPPENSAAFSFVQPPSTSSMFNQKSNTGGTTALLFPSSTAASGGFGSSALGGAAPNNPFEAAPALANNPFAAAPTNPFEAAPALANNPFGAPPASSFKTFANSGGSSGSIFGSTSTKTQFFTDVSSTGIPASSSSSTTFSTNPFGGAVASLPATTTLLEQSVAPSVSMDAAPAVPAVVPAPVDNFSKTGSEDIIPTATDIFSKPEPNASSGAGSETAVPAPAPVVTIDTRAAFTQAAFEDRRDNIFDFSKRADPSPANPTPQVNAETGTDVIADATLVEVDMETEPEIMPAQAEENDAAPSAASETDVSSSTVSAAGEVGAMSTDEVVAEDMAVEPEIVVVPETAPVATAIAPSQDIVEEAPLAVSVAAAPKTIPEVVVVAPSPATAVPDKAAVTSKPNIVRISSSSSSSSVAALVMAPPRKIVEAVTSAPSPAVAVPKKAAVTSKPNAVQTPSKKRPLEETASSSSVPAQAVVVKRGRISLSSGILKLGGTSRCVLLI
jgi:nucleoprotein TPR